MDDVRLKDLGERRLVSEVLAPRYKSDALKFGDDCAVLPVGAGSVVVTTDPCPPPMAHQLGHTDEYFRGWLLATINLSDLAAAGAEPLGLLTSLIVPSEMRLADFDRLLDGVDDCCVASGTRVVGGNLKEGPRVDVAATAVGFVHGDAYSRSTARVGDVVFVAGPFGEFWAATLLSRAGSVATELDRQLLQRTVLTPMPQLSFARSARSAGIALTLMDNSDGLGPSVEELARSSGVGIAIELDEFSLSDGVADAASRLDVDPVRLAFGWGDWNVVGACSAGEFDLLGRISAEAGVDLQAIGRVTSTPDVIVKRGSEAAPLLAPDSERLTADSWMSSGIETYIDGLLTFELP